MPSGTATTTPHQRSIAEQISGWRRLFGPATRDSLDGTTIEDPYTIDTWVIEERFDPDFDQGTTTIGSDNTPPISWSIHNGGRVWLPGRNAGRLEIWPLFSTEGATATIQLFSFDIIRAQYLSTTETDEEDGLRYLAYPEALETHNANIALGLPYQMSRDDAGAPATIALAASDKEIVTLNFAGTYTEYAYPSPFGQSYLPGPRQIFSTSGAYALFPYVVTVSTGDLTLLARVI